MESHTKTNSKTPVIKFFDKKPSGANVTCFIIPLATPFSEGLPLQSHPKPADSSEKVKAQALSMTTSSPCVSIVVASSDFPNLNRGRSVSDQWPAIQKSSKSPSFRK